MTGRQKKTNVASEAGLIRMVPQGRRLLVSLRRDDLDARFPGLLEAVLQSYSASTKRL